MNAPFSLTRTKPAASKPLVKKHPATEMIEASVARFEADHEAQRNRLHPMTEVFQKAADSGRTVLVGHLNAPEKLEGEAGDDARMGEAA